jgi:hypothetical protein
MPDLVIAVAAAVHNATVLYDDRGFDLIAEWSPAQATRSIVLPGTTANADHSIRAFRTPVLPHTRLVVVGTRTRPPPRSWR